MKKLVTLSRESFRFNRLLLAILSHEVSASHSVELNNPRTLALSTMRVLLATSSTCGFFRVGDRGGGAGVEASSLFSTFMSLHLGCLCRSDKQGHNIDTSCITKFLSPFLYFFLSYLYIFNISRSIWLMCYCNDQVPS